MLNKKIKIGFFGTPEYSVMILDELYNNGYEIAFIVTAPDKPRGRNMEVSPTPAKAWGLSKGITVFEPIKLRDESFVEKLKTFNCDVFVVMAYGKIIPDSILNIPKYKSLNIHPSLLPEFRGSCPIETSILEDKKDTGVTIIRMDSEMDHGPIVAVKNISIDNWPIDRDKLGKILVKEGAELISQILPNWVDGKIKEIDQDHSKATYTKKIEKEDGLIDLNDDPYKNLLKIDAYYIWPSAYFFIEKDEKKIRVKITKASLKDGKLNIEKVIPEGKKEMNYSDL